MSTTQDAAETIGAFSPPLKVGDRFRSKLAKPHHGYLVVERIEERGVVVAHYHQDGARGGHIELFENERRGMNAAGYIRL